MFWPALLAFAKTGLGQAVLGGLAGGVGSAAVGRAFATKRYPQLGPQAQAGYQSGFSSVYNSLAAESAARERQREEQAFRGNQEAERLRSEAQVREADRQWQRNLELERRDWRHQDMVKELQLQRESDILLRQRRYEQERRWPRDSAPGRALEWLLGTRGTEWTREELRHMWREWNRINYGR